MNLLTKIIEKTNHNSSIKANKSEHITNQEIIRLKRQIERLDQRITDVSMIAGEIYLNNSNDSMLEGLYKKITRLSDLRNKINDQLNETIVDLN